jgi:hypothetical protein
MKGGAVHNAGRVRNTYAYVIQHYTKREIQDLDTMLSVLTPKVRCRRRSCINNVMLLSAMPGSDIRQDASE